MQNQPHFTEKIKKTLGPNPITTTAGLLLMVLSVVGLATGRASWAEATMAFTAGAGLMAAKDGA